MLRKAGREDIPAIDRCNRAVLAENYTLHLYERLFAEDAAASCFVVEEEIEDSVEEVVGYVLLYIEMIRGAKAVSQNPTSMFYKNKLRKQLVALSLAITVLASEHGVDDLATTRLV